MGNPQGSVPEICLRPGSIRIQARDKGNPCGILPPIVPIRIKKLPFLQPKQFIHFFLKKNYVEPLLCRYANTVGGFKEDASSVLGLSLVGF